MASGWARTRFSKSNLYQGKSHKTKPKLIISDKLPPKLTDVTVHLVDGELTGAHAVKGGGEARVLEVGAVVAGALAAGLGNWEEEKHVLTVHMC